MDNWIVDNWIVDTYRRAIFERRSNYCLMSRMKWKPLKPTQGQFSTAIPDAMIAWAQGHNIRYRGSSSNNNNNNNMIQCAGPQSAVGQAVEQPRLGAVLPRIIVLKRIE